MEGDSDLKTVPSQPNLRKGPETSSRVSEVGVVDTVKLMTQRVQDWANALEWFGVSVSESASPAFVYRGSSQCVMCGDMLRLVWTSRVM
uniref:Uncharacterized protein n=1 Tax=Timema poppense TaxID=170557 RepID=A0A7R9H7P4_TIMPO|nr:unnamed protein product [Timema poppensis]